MRVGQSCMHLEWCLGSTQGVQLSLPGQICCFSCALQLLSLQYLLPFPSGEAVLMLGRSRAWVQSRFCRGSSSPFAVTLLLLPSPGQWFSCRGCSRWRGCPGTGGTAINSLCPQSSVPHRECLLLVLQVWAFAVSMENLAFGVRVLLWVLQPGPTWAGEGSGPAAPEPVAPKSRQVLRCDPCPAVGHWGSQGVTFSILPPSPPYLLSFIFPKQT